jgi:hypothetical protein
MPKSRSKRRQYQAPPAPRPKPSPPWYGPLIAALLGGGLLYLLLFYADLLPWAGPGGLGNYNLVIGFVPFIAGMILATRWR